MGLSLIVIAFLIVGAGFAQAWTIWYLRREVARLEQRLDESLDDQDLLDFQERLQDLLKQARSTGAEMVETVAKRQDALEKTLILVKEAEQKLMARAQVMEKSADAIATRAEKLQEAPRKPAAKSLSKPKAKPSAAAPTPTPSPAAAPVAPAPAPGPADDKERSYLVRPTQAAGPSKHQRIYDLADQGLTRDQISKETGVLAGEVELILNLRPKRPGRG